MSKMMRKVAAAATAAVLLALTTAPSFAFGGERHYYEPSDNGSVWSYYSGYFNHASNGTDRYVAPRHTS
jgi:hypothetical protein